MVRKALGVLAGGVLATGLLMFTPHGTPSAEAEPPGGGGDSFGWQYSESAGGFYQPPQDSTSGGGGGTPDPNDIITLVEHDVFYDCREHHPQVPGCGPDETEGTGCIQENFDRPVFAQYTFQYRYKDRDDETKWWIVETDGYYGECVETPEFVSDEEVRAEFRHELERFVSAPTLEFRPQTGLVNVPTVVWADAERGELEEEFRENITIPPSPETGRTQTLTGFIDADADYLWTFDGAAPTNTGSSQLGRKYNPAIDPMQPNDYYISGVFDTVGTHQIELNVHWEGTITVDPLGAEELLPLNFTDSTDITVEQGTAVLGR